MRLDSNFFHNKNSVDLAKDLLGKVITKITSNGVISGIINEVEAYREDDEASHTFGGRKSQRNEVMFREAGHLYVYFTYGMYYCMNIVSEKSGYGAAVLIRSVIPYKGEELMIKNRKWQGKDIKELSNGPAKVCLAFDITKKDNGINLLEDNSIIFLEDVGYKVHKINVSKRIGISKGVEKEWRFWF
ncbi:MAG: DNA-3-methyladenine glycosylase [Candidatus Gracilibacteria bacterium]|nr:DNA-3-methyladenine glycosylase [Candidatus Gracilibacteria bacterium]